MQISYQLLKKILSFLQHNKFLIVFKENEPKTKREKRVSNRNY